MIEVPPLFQKPDDYLSYLSMIRQTGAIKEIKDSWLLVRCRPDLGTLEYRIMDSPTTLNEVIAITALFQAMIAQFSTTQATSKRIVEILDVPQKWVEVNVHPVR